MTDKYVICFQSFDNQEAPFRGRIEADKGTHWRLKAGRKILLAHKGACSTVPFTLAEAGTEAYHRKVARVAPSIENPMSEVPRITPKARPTEAPKSKSKAQRPSERIAEILRR